MSSCPHCSCSACSLLRPMTTHDNRCRAMHEEIFPSGVFQPLQKYTSYFGYAQVKVLFHSAKKLFEAFQHMQYVEYTGDVRFLLANSFTTQTFCSKVRNFCMKAVELFLTAGHKSTCKACLTKTLTILNKNSAGSS